MRFDRGMCRRWRDGAAGADDENLHLLIFDKINE
jgi:hypothetical protein